jgi:hypothetical protein
LVKIIRFRPILQLAPTTPFTTPVLKLLKPRVIFPGCIFAFELFFESIRHFLHNFRDILALLELGVLRVELPLELPFSGLVLREVLHASEPGAQETIVPEIADGDLVAVEKSTGSWPLLAEAPRHLTFRDLFLEPLGQLLGHVHPIGLVFHLRVFGKEVFRQLVLLLLIITLDELDFPAQARAKVGGKREALAA